MVIKTNRLCLRQWQKSDRVAFAAMNADPDVMRFFVSPLSARESDEVIDRLAAAIDTRGYGFWAVERLDSGEFIGFTGINHLDGVLSVSPCVEIGWRLASKHWGQGFATEAALASLRYAFETAKLPEVFSFTSVPNRPSEHVMQKIGMCNTNQNFSHPALPSEHVLAEHVLYRITYDDWRVAQA